MPSPKLKTLITLVTVGLCLVATNSLAAPKKKKKKKKKNTTWAYEQNYKLLQTVQQGEIAEELTNPKNQFYQLPTTNLLTEFRPQFEGVYKAYKLVFRPRATFLGEIRDIPPLVPAPPGYTEPKKETYTGDGFLNEAYFAGTPSDKWQYVLGLQNFQWGPAELASPSNPLFRDLGLSKTYFFETRGRGLARANYSPTGQTTFIFISELFDNGVDRDASDPKFYRKGLVKAEFADESQTNYIGLVFSGMEKDRPQYGSYAHMEVAPGLTIYYDMTARKGSRQWNAELTQTGVVFKQNELQLDTWEAAALVGLRYVTEGNIDIRVEGFHQASAWDPIERQNARLVLASAPTLDNARIYSNPGSFFPGQKFAYLSVRIPDWGWKDSFTLSLRNVHSLTDNTEKLQATFDTFFGDHVLMSMGVTAGVGKVDGELTQAYKWQGFITAAWSL